MSIIINACENMIFFFYDSVLGWNLLFSVHFIFMFILEISIIRGWILNCMYTEKVCANRRIIISRIISKFPEVKKLLFFLAPKTIIQNFKVTHSKYFSAKSDWTGKKQLKNALGR